MAPQDRTNDGAAEADQADGGWHLGATEQELAFAQFQHALICLSEAFYRYIGRSLSMIADDPNLTGYDSVILHVIFTRDRPKSITELQHFTNRSDVANIQYSVRKLVRAGLVEKAPRQSGRGTAYRVTGRGREVALAYVEARRELLEQFPQEPEQLIERLRNSKNLMVSVTGLYDQASRAMSTRA